MTDDENDNHDADSDGKGAAEEEAFDEVENDDHHTMDNGKDDDDSTTRSLSASPPYDRATATVANWPPSVDITAHSDWPVEVTQSDSAAPDWLCSGDDAGDVSHNSMLFEDDAPHSMSSEADSVDVVDERGAAADLPVGDDSSPTLMLASTDAGDTQLNSVSHSFYY